jgi:hypothetical protein
MKVSKDFGIVIRRHSIKEKNIDLDIILKEFHFDGLYDESDDFISLGPFFGGDASDSCMKSLEKLGLAYIDDFFILEAYFPDWCRVEVFKADIS